MPEIRYEIDAAGKLYIDGVPAKDFKGEKAKAPKRERPRRSLSAAISQAVHRSPGPDPVRPVDAS